MRAERTIVESLSGAMVSDDLRHKTTRCDVDFLTALGQSGAHRRSGGGAVATTIFRLALTLDANDAANSLNATRQVVRDLAKAHRWPMTPRKLNTIAQHALRYFVRPVCDACHGRKFVGLAQEGGNRGVGAMRPCQTCNGSGRRPITGPFAEEVRTTVSRLEQLCTSAALDVRRRMRVRTDVG
jgi:hypothetical protein